MDLLKDRLRERLMGPYAKASKDKHNTKRDCLQRQHDHRDKSKPQRVYDDILRAQSSTFPNRTVACNHLKSTIECIEQWDF